MKTFTLIAAVAVATPAAFFVPESANSAVSADFCRPLTARNLEECCAADNWRELIRSGDRRFCPPINRLDNSSGRLGNTLPDNSGGGGGIIDDGRPGNPGNDMAKGNAGEKRDKDMAEQGGLQGNRGRSN